MIYLIVVAVAGMAFGSGFLAGIKLMIYFDTHPIQNTPFVGMPHTQGYGKKRD